MAYLYHYTDSLSLQRIKESGFIKASTDETLDCTYGKGVYLTSLDPSHHSKETVAKNNYDGGWETGMMEGKMDSYLRIYIPQSDPALHKVYSDRDIYLYRGNLNLQNFSYSYDLTNDRTTRRGAKKRLKRLRKKRQRRLQADGFLPGWF